MFCQKCGAPEAEESKFCKRCGNKLKTEPRISNKAMLIAAIAAIVSVSTALLGLLPTRSDPIKAQGEPAPAMAIVATSPSPRVSPSPRPTPRPTPKPKPTPEPTQKPVTTATPVYPYRHTPFFESPADGAVFSYPRKLVLRWVRNPHSEADRYKVTIEYGNPSHLPPWVEREIETPWDYCTFEFAGTQGVEFSGRWRVTPILADGRIGITTGWRTFRFTR